jgi:hypothetical protein
MTDQIKERLKNPALKLAEEIAAARLKRAGVTLGGDWGLPPAKPASESGDSAFSPELIRRIAGG